MTEGFYQRQMWLSRVKLITVLQQMDVIMKCSVQSPTLTEEDTEVGRIVAACHPGEVDHLGGDCAGQYSHALSAIFCRQGRLSIDQAALTRFFTAALLAKPAARGAAARRCHAGSAADREEKCKAHGQTHEASHH